MLHQHGRGGPACKGECSHGAHLPRVQGCANDYIYLDCIGVPADNTALHSGSLPGIFPWCGWHHLRPYMTPGPMTGCAFFNVTAARPRCYNGVRF